MKTLLGACLAVLLTLACGTAGAAGADPAIQGMAMLYDKIADGILAGKASEAAVVRTILQMEHDHALAALDRAKAGTKGAEDLRTAAARIGDFATEGGAAVEPVRKRLIEAGHHHHADDTGPEARYEAGYVILDKKMKAEALELAKRCAKAAEAGKAEAAEITAIRDAFSALAKKALAGK